MHLGLRFNPCKAVPVLSAGELSQISEAAAVRGLKAMGDAGSILSWVPAGQVLLPQHQAAHLCLILAALSLSCPKRHLRIGNRSSMPQILLPGRQKG